jgi:hypothetical protein
MSRYTIAVRVNNISDDDRGGTFSRLSVYRDADAVNGINTMLKGKYSGIDIVFSVVDGYMHFRLFTESESATYIERPNVPNYQFDRISFEDSDFLRAGNLENVVPPTPFILPVDEKFVGTARYNPYPLSENNEMQFFFSNDEPVLHVSETNLIIQSGYTEIDRNNIDDVIEELNKMAIETFTDSTIVCNFSIIENGDRFVTLSMSNSRSEIEFMKTEYNSFSVNNISPLLGLLGFNLEDDFSTITATGNVTITAQNGFDQPDNGDDNGDDDNGDDPVPDPVTPDDPVTPEEDEDSDFTLYVLIALGAMIVGGFIITVILVLIYKYASKNNEDDAIQNEKEDIEY